MLAVSALGLVIAGPAAARGPVEPGESTGSLRPAATCPSGWTLIAGDICERAFTSTSTLTTPTGLNIVDALVVGGGGGGAGGTGSRGGGGGGGEVTVCTGLSISGSVTVTVGSGGAGATASAGSSTVLSLTSDGGDGGSSSIATCTAAGGRGGRAPVAGITAATQATQGRGGSSGNGSFAGGNAQWISCTAPCIYNGAGGGGAGDAQAGSNAGAGRGGDGGNGTTPTAGLFAANTVAYGGGGAGGGAVATGGIGGIGGGGNGTYFSGGVFVASTPGTPHTGGGGGAGGSGTTAFAHGAAGGDGIVVLRFALSQIGTVVVIPPPPPTTTTTVPPTTTPPTTVPVTTAPPVTTTTTPLAITEGTIVATDGRLRGGDTITVVAPGFEPLEIVEVYGGSDPVLLASDAADDDGTATVAVGLPLDARGAYAIEMRSPRTGRAVSQTLMIEPRVLPATGRDTRGSAAVVVILLGAGIGLVTMGRHRTARR